MGKINSKKKGDCYERKIRDVLKESFPRLSFARTPMSGGFQHNTSNEEIRGDITNLNKDYSFLLHIECKNQKVWKLREWINQAKSDCPEKKKPIVVFHAAREVGSPATDYVCLSLNDFLELIDKDKVVIKIKKLKLKNFH